MSDLYCKDFHNRLTELNNWQIEQQKKIKTLQETQKRLLTMEHQTILSTLANKTCTSKENCLSNAGDETMNTKNSRNCHKLNDESLEDDICTAQLKLQHYKLQEPTLSWFNADCSYVQKDEGHNISSEKIYKFEGEKLTSPKRFLKRGDGLARFRMSLSDFKGLPKIYKEKKIRTYVNSKPTSVGKKLNNQNIKSSQHTAMRSNRLSKTSSKSLSIPVNIYVSDNKTKVGNKKKTEEKQVVTLENLQKKIDDVHLQSTKQCLKFCNTTQPNFSKERVNCDGEVEIPNDHGSSKVEVSYDLDVENKKDDKELKIFEILEQKINDTSFCSSSSFVDKLIEHSLSFTPSKPPTEEVKICMDSYAQEMKSSSPKFLTDEHITKDGDVNVLELNQSNKQQTFKPSENCIVLQDGTELVRFENNTGRDSEGENDGIKDVGVSDSEKSEVVRSKSVPSQPHKVNKTLLEKYVNDFKMLKINFSKAVHGMEELKEVSQKVSDNEEKEELISQHEIDLKLQRKGLQDNVKHLMNWENSSRKRLAKRNLKKIKLKPKKVEKTKTKTIENDQTEKITFDSALLKARLDELEKEIEIFRKENKILEKLQRECSAERLKLAKERKEFEKQILEEKDKFKASIIEDRKKLQKEKIVFEKYCKQIKNQPNKQEREEIANLKKEIENLKENLTAKESRWGSSQARLRNQIKVLEKENIRLKSEIDGYRKLPIRKVTFENEGSINTKIINAVNSEMDKLKPTVIKDVNGSLHTKNKSLSARVGRNLERKPIRRIKSDPNMKKPGLTDLINDFSVHDKAASSVSKDSGIETNEPLCISLPQSNKILPCNSYKFSKIGEEEKLKGRIEGSYVNTFSESSDRGTDISEEPNQERCVKGFGSSNIYILPAVEWTKHLNETSLTHHVTSKGSSRSVIQKQWQPIVSFTQQPVFDRKETESGDFELRHLSKCDVSSETSDHVESLLSVPAAALNYDKAIHINETVTSLMKDYQSKRSQSYAEDYFEKRGIQNKNDLLENLYCYEDYLTENNIEESKIRERTLEDGVKEICYPNGNVKKIYPGNKIVKIVYYNGDIKETNELEGSEKYYYAETKTWHTTYRDGFEVLEFPNGQTERRHANGTTEVSFPNGCVRYCDGFGRDEWRFLDGTVIKTNEKGHKILLMPNGQKEIHTKEFKRREYPDGTVKMLYADGTQETRYACGRVRLKDKVGNLIMDSEGIS